MEKQKKDKIIVENITKAYKMYKNPIDRMKEGLSISGKKYHKDFYALSNISLIVSLSLLSRREA